MNKNMTNEEVIESLKCIKAMIEWEESLDFQIALDIALESLEKQIAKRPLNADITNEHGYGTCPSCGKDIDMVESCFYCDYCGQKILWE